MRRYCKKSEKPNKKLKKWGVVCFLFVSGNGMLRNNLWVADATILPQALGLPPILTIMALAMRIAKIIKD